MTRGTLKRPASRAASGALASAASRSSDGRDARRRRSASCPPIDVRGRRHAGRVDLLHGVGVREDVAELTRKEFGFRGIELQVRERGDGVDLRPRESGGHARC